MLRSVAAYVIAAVLLLLSTNAFRQALSEFGDTEPGSLLFAVLQLVIGTSAVAAAIGLVRRKRWAAPSAAIWGVATAALLAVQPLFEPMDTDAEQSIWLASAGVVVVAAGVSWFAHRFRQAGARSRAESEHATVEPPVPVLLDDARQPAEPIIDRAGGAHVSRGTAGRDEMPRGSGE